MKKKMEMKGENCDFENHDSFKVLKFKYNIANSKGKLKIWLNAFFCIILTFSLFNLGNYIENQKTEKLAFEIIGEYGATIEILSIMGFFIMMSISALVFLKLFHCPEFENFKDLNNKLNDVTSSHNRKIIYFDKIFDTLLNFESQIFYSLKKDEISSETFKILKKEINEKDRNYLLQMSNREKFNYYYVIKCLRNKISNNF